MQTDKIDQLTDTVYNTIMQRGASGKMTDLITGFNEVKALLEDELNKEFKRGYQTAKTEDRAKKIDKQQKQN